MKGVLRSTPTEWFFRSVRVRFGRTFGSAFGPRLRPELLKGELLVLLFRRFAEIGRLAERGDRNV